MKEYKITKQEKELIIQWLRTDYSLEDCIDQVETAKYYINDLGQIKLEWKEVYNLIKIENGIVEMIECGEIQSETENEFTLEEVITFIKAFHLDSVNGNYNIQLMNFCENWINYHIRKNIDRETYLKNAISK